MTITLRFLKYLNLIAFTCNNKFFKINPYLLNEFVGIYDYMNSGFYSFYTGSQNSHQSEINSDMPFLWRGPRDVKLLSVVLSITLGGLHFSAQASCASGDVANVETSTCSVATGSLVIEQTGGVTPAVAGQTLIGNPGIPTGAVGLIGIDNAITLSSLTNNGTVSGGQGGPSLGQSGGTGGAGVNNTGAGSITILTNNSQIYGGAGGTALNSGANGGAGGDAIDNQGFITTLSNTVGSAIFGGNGTGLLPSNYGWPGSGGVGVYSSGAGTIATFNNAGTISGGNGGSSNLSSGISGNSGVTNKGSITLFTNSGNITGGNGGSTLTSGTAGSGANGILNSGTISAITNTGTLNGGLMGSGGTNNPSNGVGIYNQPGFRRNPSGVITTLNNSQGATNSALTYLGILPTNYNIIINDATHYGQLAVTNVTGNTIFGIYGGSTVAAGTYADVLQGFSNLNNITGTSGTYSGFSYSLVEHNANSGYWNLVFASLSTNILSGTYQSSDIGGSVNPKFDGGILQVTFAGTITTPTTITSNNGTIDQHGLVSNFSGSITNDTNGVAGKLTIENTGTANQGSVTLSGTNTYSGGTQVNAGANLIINSGAALGTGTLALVGSPTIAATLTTTASTTIANAITVSGDPIFNVAPTTTTTVSGVIADGGSPGDVGVQGGGTLNLTNTNTYTGPTTIDSGSTLALSGSGSIANSSGVNNAGTLDISGSTNGALIKSLSGTGNTLLGSQTLTLTNANDNYSGVLSGTNGSLSIAGGTETLSGVNNYTGATTVNSGSTLALSGSGSIANSSVVNNAGTLDISGSTNGALIKSLSGAGNTLLGSQTLTLINASDSYSGVLSGTNGSLAITGGTETLSGINNYTGATTVNSGSSLALSGSGSIANSSGVNNAGTFDISGTTNGAAIKSLSGTGSTTLGSKALTLTNASDSYSGVLSGTNGSLAITGGIETLSGVNTYTGATTVNSGSTLALSGSGSIANSSGVNNAGTLDISGSTNGAAIKSLSGTGSTTLGSKALTLTNASDSYSGVLSGTNGSLAITGGIETLSGVNTYTGATTVNSGSTLALSGSGSIANSSGVNNAGTLDISGSTNGAAIKSLSGTGSTTLGSKAITLTNANDNYSGVLSGTNGSLSIAGGTETLTGTNTHTGTSAIGAGSTLALSGSGSIANSNVANSGIFNIQNTANNVTVAGFSQAASGLLTMNFAPTHNQKLLVNGTTSLAGGLSLAAAAGHYVPGHYTLLTSTGLLSGSFANVAISSLANYTNLGYSLSYDAHDVYLDLLPNLLNTQASLQSNVSALQGVYALQTGTVNNSLNYDCNNFGSKGFCLSTGGRYSNASESTTNTTSAMIIAGYHINDHLRIGASIDQNLYNTDVAQIASVRSNTPLMGAFVVWNQNADKTGFETKVAAGYNNSDLNVNRSVVGTSEAGQGSTALNTLSESMTTSYAIKLGENYLVSPYAGVRHTSVSANAYTEQSSANVTTPLSYNGLNQESTSALLGVRLAGQVYKNTTVQTSAGFEEDMHNSVNNYSATGLAGLSAITFNPNIQRTRAVVNFGASYELAKGHHLGFNTIYRQESFQGVDTKMAYVNYSMGF